MVNKIKMWKVETGSLRIHDDDFTIIGKDVQEVISKFSKLKFEYEPKPTIKDIRSIELIASED